jgi:hypothetical protein
VDRRLTDIRPIAPAWTLGDRISRGLDTLEVIEVRAELGAGPAGRETGVVKPRSEKPAQAVRGDPDARFTSEPAQSRAEGRAERCGPPMLLSRPTLLLFGTASDNAANSRE